LARVWKIVRFSLWFTNLLHRFPGQSQFDLNLQRADLALLRDHAAMQKIVSDSYVGLVR
jgi:p-hydroxybenzoate 3-monooxygenase